MAEPARHFAAALQAVLSGTPSGALYRSMLPPGAVTLDAAGLPTPPPLPAGYTAARAARAAAGVARSLLPPSPHMTPSPPAARRPPSPLQRAVSWRQGVAVDAASPARSPPRATPHAVTLAAGTGAVSALTPALASAPAPAPALPAANVGSYSDSCPLPVEGDTPLHGAVSYSYAGDAAVDAAVAAAAPQLSPRNARGCTPLHSATSAAYFYGMQALLDAGADVDAADSGGSRAIHIACSDAAYAVELVQLLVGSGADVNATDRGGVRPLYIATLFGNLDCMAALLHYGAAVNGRTVGGDTALHAAVAHSDSLAVRLLLQCGALATIPDAAGRTARTLARATDAGIDAMIGEHEARQATVYLTATATLAPVPRTPSPSPPPPPAGVGEERDLTFFSPAAGPPSPPPRVAARDAHAALLAEVARLRAENAVLVARAQTAAALTALVDDLTSELNDTRAMVAQLSAECARYRAALTTRTPPPMPPPATAARPAAPPVTLNFSAPPPPSPARRLSLPLPLPLQATRIPHPPWHIRKPHPPPTPDA